VGQARLKSRNLAALVASEPRCIYCANAPESAEHMPPIGMFRARSRPSGMEFAACTECNIGTSGADLVAAFFARISQSENPRMIAEAASLRGKLEKLAPGVLAEFLQPTSRRDAWQRTPSGVLKPMIVVNMDGPLTKSYLTVFGAKLGMALYREHTGVALPLDGAVQIMCFMNAGLAQRTGDEILKKLPIAETLRQGKFMVPEQFAYRYNTDARSIVAALAGFNSNLHIFMAATSQPDFYHFPIAAPHFQLVRPGQLTKILPSKAAGLAKSLNLTSNERQNG
jgi:hypothetical protein